MRDLILALVEWFALFAVLLALPPDDDAERDARFRKFAAWFRS